MTIFILQSLFSLALSRRKKVLPHFLMMFACNLLFLLGLMMGAKYLNQHSAKPLVTVLKTIRKPEEEVIHYYKFYQDVPVYLEQRVTIAADWTSPRIPYNDNWQRELWYGMPFQDTRDWLIDEKSFWEKWNGGKRVFVFLNENYFDQFRTHTMSYYFIAENDGIILLSNQLTKSGSEEDESQHELPQNMEIQIQESQYQD